MTGSIENILENSAAQNNVSNSYLISYETLLNFS